MKKLFCIIFVVSLFSCVEQSEKKASVKTPSVSKKEKPVLKDTDLKIAVVPALPIVDEKTMVPSTDVYISSPKFPELVYLVNDFTCDPMGPEEIRKLKIPMSANFIFKSRHAGSGTNYYGLMEDGGVELYGQRVNENGPVANPKVEPFNLIRKFDLNNRQPLDGFFICYKEDLKKELAMSIYFDRNGMANSIKFIDYQGWTPLQYNTSQVKNEGAMPTTIDQYFEIVQGGKNGILNLTHTGNWDYANYTRTSDGSALNFTIDHESTVKQGEYRKDACF